MCEFSFRGLGIRMIRYVFRYLYLYFMHLLRMSHIWSQLGIKGNVSANHLFDSLTTNTRTVDNWSQEQQEDI